MAEDMSAPKKKFLTIGEINDAAENVSTPESITNPKLEASRLNLKKLQNSRTMECLLKLKCFLLGVGLKLTNL